MKLYNVLEIQEILNLSWRQVYRLIKDGSLKTFKLGKEWRIKEEDLKAFIERKSAQWK